MGQLDSELLPVLSLSLVQIPPGDAEGHCSKYPIPGNKLSGLVKFLGKICVHMGVEKLGKFCSGAWFWSGVW